MTDGKTGRIEATIPLTLMDHVRLQLWYRWMMLPWTVVFFAIVVVLTMVVMGVANGHAPREIAERLADNWVDCALCVLLGLLAVVALPVIIVVIQWPFGAINRELKVSIDDDGVVGVRRDLEFTLRWGMVRGVAETGSAILVRGRRLLLRLPKRGFTDEMLATFHALMDQHKIHRMSAWFLR